VFGAPATHSLHYWDKFLAGIAQHVVHARRRALGREPADDAIVFQFPKLSCYHLFTHAWQEIADFRKAARTEPQMPTFHFPAMTFEVACTGHPKWFFMGLLQSLQICAYFLDYSCAVIFEL
jgi:hypothetical protein